MHRIKSHNIFIRKVHDVCSVVDAVWDSRDRWPTVGFNKSLFLLPPTSLDCYRWDKRASRECAEAQSLTLRDRTQTFRGDEKSDLSWNTFYSIVIMPRVATDQRRAAGDDPPRQNTSLGCFFVRANGWTIIDMD